MTRKFSSILILLIFVSLALLLGGCGQKDDAANKDAADVEKPIELNFVAAYVDAHPVTINAFKPWIEKVGELSEGQLILHHYAPNTLCPEKETFDSVVGGFVDIGSSNCAFTPGKFNLTSVMALPLLVKSAESGALVMMELLELYPEIKQEYSEAQLLWMWTSATYNLHTTNKEVRTLEDLKGMRIIGWSPNELQMIRLLGANPLEIPPVDTYMALERGMADGVLCPLAPVRSFKITDVAKYHTIVDLNVSPFFSVMNKEKYDSLPSHLRKVLDDTTGVEMARACGLALDQGAVNDSKWMMENGHTFYVVPDDERERWIQAVKPMMDKWVEAMEKNGTKNAREILESAIELGKKYDEITGRGFVQ